nr:hypothetical protein [Cryptosporangium phraense]
MADGEDFEGLAEGAVDVVDEADEDVAEPARVAGECLRGYGELVSERCERRTGGGVARRDARRAEGG